MSTASEQQGASPSPPPHLDFEAGCDELGSTTELVGRTIELTTQSEVLRRAAEAPTKRQPSTGAWHSATSDRAGEPGRRPRR